MVGSEYIFGLVEFMVLKMGWSIGIIFGKNIYGIFLLIVNINFSGIFMIICVVGEGDKKLV